MPAEAFVSKITYATSSEALKFYGPLNKLFPKTLPDNIGLVELAVKNYDDINLPHRNFKVTGIHYRPHNFAGWQLEMTRIAHDMARGENRNLGNYISFHTDLLTEIENGYSPRDCLKGLEKVISGVHGVRLFIENTSPRVDSNVPSWVYDWNSFSKEFGDIIAESQGRLGTCVDIAHMMISTPNIRHDIMDYKIGKAVPANLAGFIFALHYAGEIHWSRADNKGLYEQRRIFKAATEILKHVDNKTFGQLSNSLCAFVDNMFHNHFSMIGDEDFREKLYQLLKFVEFKGVIVNEAPLLLEAIRERFPPTGNLPDEQRIGMFC